MSGFFSRGCFRRCDRAIATIAPVVISMLWLAEPAQAQATAAAWYGAEVSITEEAIEGFSDTRFEPGRALSGSVGFRFGSGLLTEFHIGQFDMLLTENGEELGRLRISRVMLGRVGYQGRPSGAGISGHLHLGAGLARVTTWDNGPAIAQMERQFGARMAVETGDDQFVLDLGGGPDVFVSRYVAVTTDLRLLLLNVSTEWRAVGRSTVQLADVDTFFASNFQGQIGVRIFLH